MGSNTNILKTPDQVLAAARYKACYELAPYWSVAIHNCIPQWVKGLGTIAISDRMHLLIDPDQWMAWYKEYGIDVMGWILVHEVNHPIREHSARAQRMGEKPEQAKIINACMDAEINDDFPGDPRKCLPEGFCWLAEDLNGQERGKLWEEYYAGLPADEQGQKYVPGHATCGKGHQDQPGPGDDSNPTPQNGGQCGSGATGVPLPQEPPQQQGQGQGQGGQPQQGQGGQGGQQGQGQHPGRSPADIERIRDQCAEAIQSHVAQHGRGSLPGGLSRWAEQRLKPPVIPWNAQIRRAARFCVAKIRGQQDYDYKRPSRRQAALGFGPGRPILPRMFSPVPKVVIGVDTSGSMGQKDLAAAMGEVDGIMKALAVPVDILTCDAKVHVAKKVANIKDACAALVGGGGTDFRPFFEAVKELHRNREPDILAIFTDGDGPAPVVNPLRRTRIIWVVVGSHGVHPYTEQGDDVPYGTVIFVPDGAGSQKEAA